MDATIHDYAADHGHVSCRRSLFAARVSRFTHAFHGYTYEGFVSIVTECASLDCQLFDILLDEMKGFRNFVTIQFVV
jgi:hypothetical protein